MQPTSNKTPTLTAKRRKETPLSSISQL
uniref:Uncharacterized protein n=1 Tax=Arundo donax TaxID=35708 RepID=A0A0A8YS20_ARUDO